MAPARRMAAFVGLSALLGAPLRPADRTAPPIVSGTDIRLAAESDRPFRRIVIGLLPRENDPYLLPRIPPTDPAKRDRRTRFLLQRLSWLSFELLHGDLMRAAPPYTRFFIAVPPRPAGVRATDVEATFREYLQARAGYSRAEIAERVRFFKVPDAVPFPRDLSVVIGSDSRGRLAIGLGRDVQPGYSRATEALVAAFPEDFVLLRIGGRGPNALSTEGGDVSLVPGPDGGLRLVVGRHRVLRVLEREGIPWNPPPVVPAAEIERVRRLYRTSFFGLQTVVLGEKLLARADRSDEDVFHADMVAALLRTRSGVKAFVPAYGPEPVDAVSRSAVSQEKILRAQTEYDESARQLLSEGYEVVRVPFADHPVRNPVNVVPFTDSRTGDASVLVARYPPVVPTSAGGPVPLFAVQDAFDDLDRAVTAWRAAPSDDTWSGAEHSLEGVFRAIDAAAAAPSPAFDQIRRIYENEGVRVLPVKLIPSGEGGLHCLVLQ